jgi:two-component system heavy metal sensor histidine kinase CusS
LTGSRRFGGSMVMRMTAWYAGTSFLLILIATGFLYWTVAANLKAEDRRILTNTAANLQYLLREQVNSNFAKHVLSEHVLVGAAGSVAHPQFIWIRVIAPDGRTQLETNGMDAALPVTDFPALMAIPLHHDVIRTAQTRSGQLFQTLSTRIAGPNGMGRVFQVALNRTDEQRLLVGYRERLLFVLIISLALCSATGFAIARSGMRPVERIIRTARTIRSSTLHERIDVAGLPAELHALADTFNGMLDRLEDSFAQISQFSADVAHELRTPVNNLRGEIEVALGKARSFEEYRDVLGSALEECTRISRVIQSLLFLARAETAGESPHLEALDVKAEIASILEFFEPTAAEAGVDLSAEGDDGLIAAFDRTLFQQAVGNLIANAIAHTPHGGRIAIQFRRDAGSSLRIEVTDTGSGIAAEHLPYVFNRFYRADPARSSTGGNFGLGLAVVKSIATLHGGSVLIESKPGAGTIVVLRTSLIT